jgi:DNA-binding IscR family transcriptional regulator
MSLTPDMVQEPGHDGLWVSVSDLAARKGVTKQTIAEKVAKLEKAGLLTTRPGAGRKKLVNVAEYDFAIGRTRDALREMGAATKAEIKAQSPPAPTSSVLNLSEQQAQRLFYQTEITRLELEERQGKLRRVEEIEHGMARCGEALVRAIDQLPSRADDLAGAIVRDGVVGARGFLKTMARELRAVLAREMRLQDDEGLDDERDGKTDGVEEFDA